MILRKKHVHDYNKRISSSRRALWVEIIATCCLTMAVVVIGWGTLHNQSEEYASEVKKDYTATIDNYVTNFNTMTVLVEEEIKKNPSYEEMNKWLQSMDSVFKNAIGSDVYDSFAMTYKGDYARSWLYGDYADYDPATRPWYQKAQRANGNVAVVAPYVTFLDASYLNEDQCIIMSIVRKYNDEISFDYDLKIKGIETMLTGGNLLYKGSNIILYDPDGYVLSCTDGKAFAHNVYKSDKAISKSLSSFLTDNKDNINTLIFGRVDGKLQYGYLSKDDEGNTIVMMYPFMQVFIKNFLPIMLIALFLIVFEIFLYINNKKSMLEFKARDHRLTSLADASYDGLIYVDLEDYSFYGNQRALDMCPSGTYEEIYALYKSRLVNQSDIEGFNDFISKEALKRDFNTEYKIENKRFRMRWYADAKSSKEVTLEISRMPFYVEGIRTFGLAYRDVTENAEMLKDALRQAESASAAKGSFLSNMSHEIRTPLNAIIGYLSIAKDSDNDYEKVMGYIDNCETASKHLLQIINDVLDMSSIETGKLKIAYEDFDLKNEITDITQIFLQNAKLKNITFETHVAELTEEWVVGDQLRLNQILMNLLSNAVKFTPEAGKVILSIHQLRIDEKKVYLQFVVTDNGIGMSEDYMKRLFNPFEQESASTAKQYGGSGLGLSITNNLVSMMGGTIKVDSAQNQGASFTVTIPFDKSVSHPMGTLVSTDYSHVRALVVDDEKDQGNYVKTILKRCGVKSDSVTDGKTALKRIKSRAATDYPYDLVIVDWNMPEMDGVEVATKIREEFGNTIPIIIATAYDTASFADQAYEAGVNKIISKPLFQSTLFDLLVSTFGKYEPEEDKPNDKKIDLSGVRIILAEDNEMNMDIAVTVLGKSGVKVDQAVNGQEAYDLFYNAPAGTYDMILMDVQMPILDGYSATQKIRNSDHEEAESIPIIAMTANAFAEDIAEALSHGMNAHISKPINYDKLFAAVQKFSR